MANGKTCYVLAPRAGGKYSPPIEHPRVIDKVTCLSNWEGFVCMALAASLFSGSSGLGACTNFRKALFFKKL